MMLIPSGQLLGASHEVRFVSYVHVLIASQVDAESNPVVVIDSIQFETVCQN
jgi:hypothetical protein